MSGYIETFKSSLIENSNSESYENALQEWVVANLHYADDPNQCICGHPIKQNCLAKNVQNGKQLIIGNCCIKKFWGKDFANIFSALKRIREDVGKGASKDLLSYAHSKGYISDWQYQFGVDTEKKRKMTDRQINQRRIINKIIIKHMVNIKQ